MAYKTKFDGSTDKTMTLGAPEQPTSLEGYFLGSKDVDGDYGVQKLHIFQTPEGNIGVWGKTRLNNLLTTDLVGQMTLVEFTGMIEPKKKGRKPSYGYKVQHDPDNTIEVTAALGGTSDAADDYDASDDIKEAYEEAPVAVAARPVARPTAGTLKTPDAAARAKVNALLSGRKVG